MALLVCIRMKHHIIYNTLVPRYKQSTCKRNLLSWSLMLRDSVLTKCLNASSRYVYLLKYSKMHFQIFFVLKWLFTTIFADININISTLKLLYSNYYYYSTSYWLQKTSYQKKWGHIDEVLCYIVLHCTSVNIISRPRQTVRNIPLMACFSILEKKNNQR